MAGISSIKRRTTVQELWDVYKGTHAFEKLTPASKVMYENAFTRLRKYIGNVSITTVKARTCKIAYENMLETGIVPANHGVAIANIIFNLATEMEAISRNPWQFVKKRTPPKRKVVWTRDDLDKFLTVAYSEFRWRNVGIITQMCYAWCQRVVDMRQLTWDCIDFEANTVTFEQTKRRAQVFLPLQDDIKDVLLEQKNDFGFQEYVAPNTVPMHGKHSVYSTQGVSRRAQMIRDKAGLDPDLRISDLRRTGITEMVDAGVDVLHIQQVSGHANPASVMPYMKFTLKAATHALDMRSKG